MSAAKNKDLKLDEQGTARCWWGHEPADYRAYHDEEWGFPVADDYKLFEKICLEGFQSGLSWLTILRKRENFRRGFLDFDFHRIAEFNDEDVAHLLQDQTIIRHRGKIEATINNSRRAIEIVDEFGSLARYIWGWEPATEEPGIGKNDDAAPVPSITQTSLQLSRDLKKRGWKFVGPTTAYAFMQAMGLVNDHIEGCAFREVVDKARDRFQRPC